MFRFKVFNRIKITIFIAITYLCADCFVRMTGFLQFTSCVGLKSFMPATFGLLFGIYGIIGELIGTTISSIIMTRAINLLFYEYYIIIVIGIGMWFFWHIGSLSHKIHFRHLLNYLKFIFLIVILSLICSFSSKLFTRADVFGEIFIWNVSLSLLVGVPVMIIYSGLMSLNPILPPLYEDGKKISIEDDIVGTLTSESEGFAAMCEKLDNLIMREKIGMKRALEMQSLLEEIYIRIIEQFPEAVIDVKVNYDITFSVEFIYIGKKVSPFKNKKDEDEFSSAGFKIIKHRALLARYSYTYGENSVHVVI